MSQLLNQLASETGLHPNIVERIARTAPKRYKSYLIAKKTGGFRTISQPAREVKILQRALVDVLLRDLPVHAAATAYRPKHSLLDNVRPHLNAGPILKLDLKNFFPSLRDSDWRTYCITRSLLAEDDIELTSNILFHQPKGSKLLQLAIGAPSSPDLSNLLMFDFDSMVSAAVAKDSVVYTRYADDMTFSARRTGYLVDVVRTVYDIIKSLDSPKIWVNQAKTSYITKKYSRRITGITVTNDGAASLGRDRKRLIHSAVHRAKLGKLDRNALQQLAGWLGFVNSVEPSFLDTLVRRYGAATVAHIQSVVVRGSVTDKADPIF